MQVKLNKGNDASKRRGCCTSCWRLGAAVAVVLLGLVYYSTNGMDAVLNPNDDDFYDTFKWEYKSQLPASSPPKGILFLAHGCQHSMTDWWPKSKECKRCIGLPEEMAIVDLALQRQLLVVAASSYNRSSKCWSKIDGPKVAELLLKLQTEQQHGDTNDNNKLPLYAFGASSGGNFVSSVLPQALHEAGGGTLAGYVSQIMAVPLKEVTTPPAVYITMSRDAYSERSAEAICQQLQGKQVPCRQIRLDPLPISQHYFSDRILSITKSTSEQMVIALQQAAFLDDSTGMLTDNPRHCNWRAALKNLVRDNGDSLVADQSPISEVLNVAWGQHEMSRDGVGEALDFLLEHTSTTAK